MTALATTQCHEEINPLVEAIGYDKGQQIGLDPFLFDHDPFGDQRM